jgi:SAM-dependent methyltransferase
MLSNQNNLENYFYKDLRWGNTFESVAVFKFLTGVAEFAKGGVILDAGCGHKRYAPFFKESIYIGQEHPIAGAKNKGITTFEILCDIKIIPLKDSSVDAILSTSSLEHIEYPTQFFAEAYRVLKPGGKIFINVPFVYIEHEIPYDFWRPTRYGLISHFKNSGYVDYVVNPSSSSIFTAAHFFNLALRECIFFDKKIVFFRRVVYFIFRKLIEVITNKFDAPPESKTNFPIGWIAEATKPGAHHKKSHQSVESFIREKILDDENFTIDELGRIVNSPKMKTT